MSTVTIIVCTYNRAQSLARTLLALLAQEGIAAYHPELVVIDNNSSDDTRAVVERIACEAAWPVRYVFEPRQGLCYARNRAISESRGELLLFTDDDVRPEPAWASALAHAFAEHRADGVCGPVRPIWEVEPPTWARQFGGGVLAIVDYGEQPFQIRDIKHLFVGANMAFRREIFASLGAFRVDLGPNVTMPLRGDDTEFFERALAAGRTLVYEPRAAVHHHVLRGRLTRRYFRQWHYWSGYSTALYHTPERDSARTLFGMPAWAVREALVTGGRAVAAYVTGQSLRAFEQELRFWVQIGFARALGNLACRQTMHATEA